MESSPNTVMESSLEMRDQQVFYKLTTSGDVSGVRFRPLAWGENVTHRSAGSGPLGLGGWIYAYDHPLKAVFYNPLHADFNLQRAHRWECRGEGRFLADSSKWGFQSVTTIRRIPMPEIGILPIVRSAIEVAMQRVHLRLKDDSDFPAPWETWASHWLEGVDRSYLSAAVNYRAEGSFAALACFAAKSLFSPNGPDAFPFPARNAAATSVSYSLHILRDLDIVALLEKCIEAEAGKSVPDPGGDC